MTIVQKYGGSSVGTFEKIKEIAKHIKKLKSENNDLVIVVSAMGKTTDSLITMANQITARPDKRELDLLLSTGETVSAALMSMALNSLGVASIALTGAQIGIKTNAKYGKAYIDKVEVENIKNLLNQGKVIVAAGFQGVAQNGDITTLGRGGSDTTAVALAAALKCNCEIYSDVESVFTVDPNIYPDAKPLHAVTYDEMMEMAINGAKVLDARSVELAKKYNVNLYLGKSLQEDKSKGTFVVSKVSEFERMQIKNISVKNQMTVATASFDAEHLSSVQKIFSIISGSLISLELISLTNLNNRYHLTFAVPADKIDEILQNLKSAGNIKMLCSKPKSKIVLVGSGISSHTNLILPAFTVLTKADIKFYNISTSEISVSFTVDQENVAECVELLKKEYNL